MKYIVQILLIVLFLLQGTLTFNVLNLLCLLLLVGTLLFRKKISFKIPPYFLLAFFIYSIYLAIGIFHFHEEALRDIKFQFFGFLFYFWLINHQVKIDFLKLLFFINALTFLIYLLLFFNKIPNIWSEDTFGFMDRVYGPSIIPLVFIAFYYLLYKKSFDFKLALASVMGLAYIALTTNLMNLMIVALLVFLVAVNIRKLFRPVYVFFFALFVAVIVLYLNSPYVPELVAIKLKYVFNPMEYASIQTRISDLQQAINRADFGWASQLFGEGFGTHTEIYRINERAPSLSGSYRFQEIDNGFYYIYHRGGWSLLALFFLVHAYLVSRIKPFKAKIGFCIIVLITNLLSIHYFNYVFYTLLPFMILHQETLRERFTKEEGL